MRTGRGRRRGAFAVGVCALLLVGSSACLTRGPVGVTEVGPDEVYASVSSCVLDGARLSAATREVLQYFDLQRLHDEDALAALRALHARAVEEPRRPFLFALAELAYEAGRKRSDRDCYLAAAVYAYSFLLGEEDPAPPNPYDRRFRWACDLYEAGLMRAFLSGDQRHFRAEAGTRELPSGSLRITLDRSSLDADGESAVASSAGELVDMLPADRFLLRGLDLRLRDSGLGVPLIGIYSAPVGPSRDSLLQFGGNEAPVSAFLRLRGTLAELEQGIDATLELHSGFESAAITVNDESVPLETDRSVFLAHALDRAEVWQFSLRGFFSSQESASANKLILVQPYRPGRTPVIFVHGTASSPGYWADLFNSLWWDPELRQGAQFWFFRYTTGSPLAYSAADLRDALNEAVQTLDPEGRDPALRNMVVVGHSQGGLLAKLMVVPGRVALLEQVTGLPLADFGLTPDQDRLLRRVLEFEPVPWVKRVVFLSTPHRGSFLATKWYSRLLAKMIELPRDVTDLGINLLKRQERLPPELRGRMPTSLDNMNPENPYLVNLLATPIAPGVESHSIIAIGSADADDPEELAEADDGVVSYASAHIDGVASEFLVPSGHSCQAHPATIQEVRRILREHLRAAAAGPAPR